MSMKFCNTLSLTYKISLSTSTIDKLIGDFNAISYTLIHILQMINNCTLYPNWGYSEVSRRLQLTNIESVEPKLILMHVHNNFRHWNFAKFYTLKIKVGLYYIDLSIADNPLVWRTWLNNLMSYNWL